MTKTETTVYLKEIDEYFRIHGWCTQTNVKITNFMALLDSGSMKYVEDWAYVTLRKGNIKNPTRILSIIFLKLLNVPDSELIRLLFTVLYGKLTFEDFNSLNTYIFKGKPPLSKDLFYNITERVFIDKKSALQKALSVSSIITRADPELTIFYMTMLLCRVDLNNENKAMLNLLLYCIDADIPEEVSKGVREYLLSITDILEEIFKEPGNGGFKRVLDTIHTSREEKIASPAFIPFEIQREESFSDNSGKSPVNKKNTHDVENISENLADDSDFVFSGNRLQQSQSAREVSSQKKSGSPSELNISPQNRKATGRENILPAEGSSAGESSVKVKKSSVNSNGSKEGTSAESRSGDSGKSTGVTTPVVDSAALKNTALNKNRELSPDQKAGPDGKGTAGGVANSLPESGDAAVPADSTETESSIPTSYELKMKTFRLSDLLSWGRGEKGKAGTKKPNEMRLSVSDEISSKKEQQPHGRKITVNSHSGKNMRIGISALLAVALLAGWFLLKPDKKVRQIPSVQSLAGKEEVTEPGASESAFQNKESNVGVSDTRSIPGTEKEWNISETGRGIEWTVQKGESVWKLYIYLNGHTADFSGALKQASQKDWLPFIHQIIKLNPAKSFAEPIEPGEKFLVSSK